MKRLTAPLVAFGAAIGLAVVFAPMATADQPVITHKTTSATTVLTGACSFPITVDFTVSETDRFFFDTSGTLIRESAQANEQDTFTANAKSLTGLPYTVNLVAHFDSSGNITQLYADGVIERVPLPEGSVFQSAGRVNFAADGFPDFTITSDWGSARNLTGFCAALSPEV
jgi:hypothetical protein